MICHRLQTVAWLAAKPVTLKWYTIIILSERALLCELFNWVYRLHFAYNITNRACIYLLIYYTQQSFFRRLPAVSLSGKRGFRWRQRFRGDMSGVTWPTTRVQRMCYGPRRRPLRALRRRVLRNADQRVGMNTNIRLIIATTRLWDFSLVIRWVVS